MSRNILYLGDACIRRHDIKNESCNSLRGGLQSNVFGDKICDLL